MIKNILIVMVGTLLAIAVALASLSYVGGMILEDAQSSFMEGFEQGFEGGFEE